MSFSLSQKNVSPLECAARKLKQARNVVTLSGAGISTSAGICDFRSPETGLYHQLRKYNVQYADIMWDKNYFYNRPDTLYRILKGNFFHNALKPTLTHCFIKLLETKGILLRHFTQNIDGMEAMTGLSPERLIEAHGTIHRAYCVLCEAPYTFQWLVNKVDDNLVPVCDACGGLVRPDIVLFGEELKMNFSFRAFIDLPQCDFLIVLGTSLLIEPFASLVNECPPECPRVVINRHLPAELKSGRVRASYRSTDDADDIFIGGDCDTTILELAKLMNWEGDLFSVVRDVKLKKLYGDVKFVDVAGQTLPWSESDSIEWPIPYIYNYEKTRMNCQDYSKVAKLSSERTSSPNSKNGATAVENVDSYKVKGSSNGLVGVTIKARSLLPTKLQNKDPRFCIKCYASQCLPSKNPLEK